MSRKTNIIHYIAAGVSWAVFVISAVFLIAVYPSLPEQIGMHFGPDGNFDVYGDKAWAFYPYIVAFVSLLIFGALSFAARKMKLRKKAKENTYDVISRELILFLLDAYKLVFSLFFAGEWAYCVLCQRALRTETGIISAAVVFSGLFSVAIALIVLYILSKRAEKAAKS